MADAEAMAMKHDDRPSVSKHRRRKPIRPFAKRRIDVPLPRNTEPPPTQDVRSALAWLIPLSWRRT